jgi:hypothetical protein
VTSKKPQIDLARDSDKATTSSPPAPGGRGSRALRYLSRCDIPSPSWQVDIVDGDKRWLQSFADRDHGGSPQALAAAQAWRDRVVAQQRQIRRLEQGARSHVKINNTSGFTGVSRTFRGGGEHATPSRWVATWRDLESRRHAVGFSVRTHGDEGAKALAVQAYAAAMARLQEEALRRAAPVEPATQSTPPEAGNLHNIYRIELASGSRGWHVNVKRGNQPLTRHFGDSTFGGHANALAAARAWRDEMMRKVSVPDYVVWRRDIVKSHNTSGIVGVHRNVVRTRSKGKLVETSYWTGCWTTLDGKTRARAFNIAKYGEEQAKLLAARFREEGMREVRDEAAAVAVVSQASPRRDAGNPSEARNEAALTRRKATGSKSA